MEETITAEQIKARRAKIIEPPWFVAFDDAKECGPHKDSGLALVDTGRSNDWPIARLCYWPQAEFIANAPTDIDYLLVRVAEMEAALRESAVYAHGLSGLHSPNFVSFEDCKRRPCVKARAALAEQPDGEGK